MVAPVASVVVTNHDYARYLAAAIDSALAQGTPTAPVEVIVVDDGSTDGSGVVLDGYADRVEVLRQENGGQGAAMNAGFARTAGPVVLFLDADDLLDPGVIELVRARFDADPAMGRVQFPLGCIDEHGRDLGRTIPPDPARLPVGDLRQAVLEHPDDLGWMPTTGNTFRTSVLAAILPMPEAPYRISADHYLSNLSALFGTVGVLPHPGGRYRIHGANADHRERLDLVRVRSIIERTLHTHTELARAAAAHDLGAFPEDPLAVASVSFVGNRLVSLRLEPDAHPIPSDRVSTLLRDGLRAVAARRDLRLGRRLLAAGWVLGVAVAPRSLVRRLAERGLVG